MLPTVTDQTLAQAKDRDGLVLIDIWAVWCGPCKMLTPVLERLAADDGVPVYGLDADSNPDTMTTLQIMSIPTVLVYFDGRLVDKLTGMRPYAKLKKELGVYLTNRVEPDLDPVVYN